MTSSGTNSECAPVDNSFDADVFANLAWIDREGGADLASATCGAGPQIGETGTNVTGFDGTLSRRSPAASASFIVPPGTAELRVSLMQAEGFDNPNALFILHAGPATPTAFDCKRDEPGGLELGC